MRFRRLRSAATTYLLASLAACTGGDESGHLEPSIPAIEANRLADLFPAELMGMVRGDLTTQNASGLGYDITFASAGYEGDGRKVQVNVTDYPGGGPALAAANVWTMKNFNRTTSTGHERTTQVDGYRGFESFDKGSGGRSELSAFVGNRVVFHAAGEGMSMEELRRVVSDFRLKRLERLVTR